MTMPSPLALSPLLSLLLLLPFASAASGNTFDRIVLVLFENTDYSLASTSPYLRTLAGSGITLPAYHGTTHPSQPNYLSLIAGDYFGLDDSHPVSLPGNVKTVVSLLESRNISWATYQEDLPSPGWDGEKNELYARKHNPFVSFQSITNSRDRLAKIKPFPMPTKGLEEYVFVTPNLHNDGHDTGLPHAVRWLEGWLGETKVLEMEKTLVIVTFDENHTYTKRNRVFTLLLGAAVPSHLRNTTDETPYSHYSVLKTIEENWKLGSLGRWDIGANGFFSDKKDSLPSLDGVWLNESYTGCLSDRKNNKPRSEDVPTPDFSDEGIDERVWAGYPTVKAGQEVETIYSRRVLPPGKEGAEKRKVKVTDKVVRSGVAKGGLMDEAAAATATGSPTSAQKPAQTPNAAARAQEYRVGTLVMATLAAVVVMTLVEWSFGGLFLI